MAGFIEHIVGSIATITTTIHHHDYGGVNEEARLQEHFSLVSGLHNQARNGKSDDSALPPRKYWGFQPQVTLL